jgi:hypothetical protein
MKSRPSPAAPPVPCTAREYRTAPRPPHGTTQQPQACAGSTLPPPLLRRAERTGHHRVRFRHVFAAVRALSRSPCPTSCVILRSRVLEALALATRRATMRTPTLSGGQPTRPRSSPRAHIVAACPAGCAVGHDVTSNATLHLMKSSGRDSALSLRLITSSTQQNARAVQGNGDRVQLRQAAASKTGRSRARFPRFSIFVLVGHDVSGGRR